MLPAITTLPLALPPPASPACAAAWQSERLGAVLFATADTLPDLRKIDDALRCANRACGLWAVGWAWRIGDATARLSAPLLSLTRLFLLRPAAASA